MTAQKRVLSASLLFAALWACGGASRDIAGPIGEAANPPILLPVEADPIVSFIVWVPVGSAHDPVGQEGLAWLTGQLISEGATTNNSYDRVLERLYPMAGSYSVRVDREMTTISGRVHRDHLSRFLPLFADAFARPAFAATDIERIRGTGLSYLEKTLRYASDEDLGKAALNGALYRGTRYAHPIQGTVGGLKAINSGSIREFYRRHYNAANVTFAMGGAYTDDALASLKGTRALLPPGPPSPVVKVTPKTLSGRKVLLVDKPGADASISFGFPLDVSRGDRDFYALWIASSWLGEHRNSSSHLYKVIRGARGLNYGDYSYIEAYPEGGRRQKPPTNVARRQQFFEVWIRTLPNDKALFALRAALREYDRLIEHGMSKEQFELTRTFLSKYIRHYAPTTSARLGYAVDDRFYGIEQGHLELAQKRFAELTHSEVNAAIKRYFQDDNLQFAVVTGKATEMKKALSSDAPSPITYPAPKPKSILEEDKEIAVVPLSISAHAIETVSVDAMFAR